VIQGEMAKYLIQTYILFDPEWCIYSRTLFLFTVRHIHEPTCQWLYFLQHLGLAALITSFVGILSCTHANK